MDSNNYVAPSNGGYVVVKGGQIVGQYATQQEAEQAYNGGSGDATGQSYSYDPGAASAATAAAGQAADTAYKQWLQQTGNDRLAFEKATEAWNQSFRQSQANIANSLDYLGLASKLSGPANAFEYAKLLTGTPGGLADIVRAAGGAYRLPAVGGGSLAPSVPLSIDSIVHDVGAYSPTANGGGSLPPVAGAMPGVSGQYSTVNGPKTLAQMAAELKVANPGGNYTDPATIQSVYASTTKGSVTPMAATVDTSGNHTMLPAAQEPNNPLTDPFVGTGYIPSYGGLPKTGNQFSPQNLANMDPSQLALLGAAYQNQGYNWNDIQSQFTKSLRPYGGPSRGYSSF